MAPTVLLSESVIHSSNGFTYEDPHGASVDKRSYNALSQSHGKSATHLGAVAAGEAFIS